MRSIRSFFVATLVAALPTTAFAQALSLENLQIHGYLTQGYAGSTHLALAGIPTDATGDLRSAALQFRYSISDADNLVVQFRHRRLGTGPLAAMEPNVALNWAFYTHKFEHVGVKIGKLPMPRGIYNEVRSVGTILPFYRAPVNYYMEGFETLDGASVTSSLSLGKAGSFDVAGFAGGFDVDIASPDRTTGLMRGTSIRMERAAGGQIWYNTPIQGLRVSVDGMRFRERKATDSSVTPTMSVWSTSIDGTFSRVTVRGEFSNIAVTSGRWTSYYGQVGAKITDKLTLNVQNDIGEQSGRFGAGLTRFRTGRDFAVGAGYQVSPNLVFKVEQHDARFRAMPAPMVPQQTTKYAIASVSTSF